MKKIALYFAVLTLITFVGSCKKDSVPPYSLTGSYEGAKYREVSELKIFTADGEITNSDLIKKIISNYDDDLFVFTETEALPKGNAEIDFPGNGTATINVSENTKTTPYSFTITEKTDKGFVLTELKSSSVVKPLDFNNIDKIVSSSNQISEFSNCKENLNIQTQVCDYNRKFPFIIKSKKVYLSSYSFLVYHKTQQQSQYVWVKNAIGIFNSASTRLLSSNDTLLVQTKHWQFIKKN